VWHILWLLLYRGSPERRGGRERPRAVKGVSVGKQMCWGLCWGLNLACSTLLDGQCIFVLGDAIETTTWDMGMPCVWWHRWLVPALKLARTLANSHQGS
jgi:hypothetical protein